MKKSLFTFIYSSKRAHVPGKPERYVYYEYRVYYRKVEKAWWKGYRHTIRPPDCELYHKINKTKEPKIILGGDLETKSI